MTKSKISTMQKIIKVVLKVALIAVMALVFYKLPGIIDEKVSQIQRKNKGIK